MGVLLCQSMGGLDVLAFPTLRFKSHSADRLIYHRRSLATETPLS